MVGPIMRLNFTAVDVHPEADKIAKLSLPSIRDFRYGLRRQIRAQHLPCAELGLLRLEERSSYEVDDRRIADCRDAWGRWGAHHS